MIVFPCPTIINIAHDDVSACVESRKFKGLGAIRSEHFKAIRSIMHLEKLNSAAKGFLKILSVAGSIIFKSIFKLIEFLFFIEIIFWVILLIGLLCLWLFL